VEYVRQTSGFSGRLLFHTAREAIMTLKACQLLSIPLLTLSLACHDTTDIAQPPLPGGALTYTGYDEGGAPVVEGWVALDVAIIAADPSIPSNVTGTWSLRRVGAGGSIGPQVGQGALEGLLQDGRLFVNFNPTRTDDNVIGDGELTVIGGPASGMRWEGAWTWIDLTGPRRTGTFRAKS
jgi:hypothetical protein